MKRETETEKQKETKRDRDEQRRPDRDRRTETNSNSTQEKTPYEKKGTISVNFPTPAASHANRKADAHVPTVALQNASRPKHFLTRERRRRTLSS